MIEKNGVPSMNQVKAEFPTQETLAKPKAIIECYKRIPCNPCETSCPFDAITVGEDINERPRIDFEKCTGCGICVYNCPGLAITVTQIKGDQAHLKIPYEFTPLPEKGESVNVMSRSGEVITQGTVTKVQAGKKQNKTALIHLSIPKEFLYDAITIEVSYGS